MVVVSADLEAVADWVSRQKRVISVEELALYLQYPLSDTYVVAKQLAGRVHQIWREQNLYFAPSPKLLPDAQWDLGARCYWLAAPEVNRVKIGVVLHASPVAIRVRISTLIGANAARLRFIGAEPVESGVKDEQDLHEWFSSHREHGEWFTFAEPLREYAAKVFGFDATKDL